MTTTQQRFMQYGLYALEVQTLEARWYKRLLFFVAYCVFVGAAAGHVSSFAWGIFFYLAMTLAPAVWLVASYHRSHTQIRKDYGVGKEEARAAA